MPPNLGSPDDIPRDLAERPMRERHAKVGCFLAPIVAVAALALVLTGLWWMFG